MILFPFLLLQHIEIGNPNQKYSTFEVKLGFRVVKWLCILADAYFPNKEKKSGGHLDLILG